MKKLLIPAAVLVSIGAGAVYSSGPTYSREEMETMISSMWNVEAVQSTSWVDQEDRWMVLVTWKDLTKGQDAARGLCLHAPLKEVHWDNKLGEARSYRCNE